MTEEEMKWGKEGREILLDFWEKKNKTESQSRITLLAEGPQDKNVQR